jgi:uncharacterized membrane-anchored protein
MDHPLRAELVEEVHARPFVALEPPVQVSHLALVSGEHGAAADFAQLVRLCKRFGLSPPTGGSKHFRCDFGAFLLKWERHGEFCTYTFFCPGSLEQPFSSPAILTVPRDWLETLPGKRLVAVHVAVEPRHGPPRSAVDLAAIFRSETISGSRVFGGAALTWTDFAVHEDGFGRILVRDIGLDHFETGRLVQRLLEIETYRMMALVALPLVQEHGPQISLIEEETAKIARGMSEIAGLDDTRALLTRLSRLSADVEGITARLSYRFDATRAYFALVRRRIERLREERLERLQTIDEFMERVRAMILHQPGGQPTPSCDRSQSPGDVARAVLRPDHQPQGRIESAPCISPIDCWGVQSHLGISAASWNFCVSAERAIAFCRTPESFNPNEIAMNIEDAMNKVKNQLNQGEILHVVGSIEKDADGGKIRV